MHTIQKKHMYNNTPLVSVAIPAYKSIYLQDAIDSVLGQSIQDIELIIVNDASPNPIEDVVRKYDDPRIRYYCNAVNLGAKDPVANWNKCLSYATGKYFCLLCDDDIYLPSFLEEMVKLAESNKSCNVFKSGVAIVDSNDKEVGCYPESPAWESCYDYIYNVSLRKRKQTISEWMFRREHIVSLGGYEPVPLAWGSDYLSIMKFAVNGGIASTTSCLAVFRQSGLNLSTKSDSNVEAKLQGILEYERKLNMIANNNPELSKPIIFNAIKEIKIFEQKALLSGTSFRAMLRLFSKLNSLGLSKVMWLNSTFKQMIKQILCIS